VGVVTPDGGGEYWKGLLAMDAMGRLDETERARLSAHVNGCTGCQTDRFELFGVVGALALVDRATTGDLPGRSAHESDSHPAAGRAGPEPPPVVHQSGPVHRRRLARAGGVLAATVLVALGAVGLVHHAPAGSRTIALRGQGGRHATAVLVPEPWGTRIELTDEGAPPSPDLTVAMHTEYGARWVAGSYHAGAAGELTVTLSCALPVDRIDGISVTDARGRVVLHG
jgi:hypothetical protein